MENRNFFANREMETSMKKNIMNMLSKAQFSEQEIRTLRGIVSCLTKIGVDNT